MERMLWFQRRLISVFSVYSVVLNRFLLAHRWIRLISAIAMDGILRGAGFTLANGF